MTHYLFKDISFDFYLFLSLSLEFSTNAKTLPLVLLEKFYFQNKYVYPQLLYAIIMTLLQDMLLKMHLVVIFINVCLFGGTWKAWKIQTEKRVGGPTIPIAPRLLARKTGNFQYRTEYTDGFLRAEFQFVG